MNKEKKVKIFDFHKSTDEILRTINGYFKDVFRYNLLQIFYQFMVSIYLFVDYLNFYKSLTPFDDSLRSKYIYLCPIV